MLISVARLVRPVDLRRADKVTGDLADQGMDAWAWRNGCFKNGVVATDALITRLGRDYPVPDVGSRMRCSRGGRDSRRGRTGRTVWP